MKHSGSQVINFVQGHLHELIHSNQFLTPRGATIFHYSGIFEKSRKMGHFPPNFAVFSAKPTHDLKHEQNEGKRQKTFNF